MLTDVIKPTEIVLLLNIELSFNDDPYVFIYDFILVFEKLLQSLSSVIGPHEFSLSSVKSSI